MLRPHLAAYIELDVPLACDVMGSEPLLVSTLYIPYNISHDHYANSIEHYAIQCNAVKP